MAASQEPDYRLLPNRATEPVGLTGQPGEDSEGQIPDYYLELEEPFSEFSAKGPYVNIFVLLSSVILESFCSDKGAGILSWSFIGISVACLVVSTLIHWALKFLQNVTVRCWLAYLSVFLRMVAVTFLLLLLDPVRHLVVILPISLLVLVLLSSFFVLQKRHTNQGILPGAYWREHKAKRKLAFDVSSQVLTFAFAGLLSTVYLKLSSSNQLQSGRGYMPPDCFLSYSILLGLLVQLLTTVTPYIWNMDIRDRMVNVYLPIIAYASLMFLVLASIMAAEEILQEWVFNACFIVVILPVLFIWLEYIKGPNWFQDDENSGRLRGCFIMNTKEQDSDKACQEVILGFITTLFAALMVSNSKYSIESGAAVSLSGWFKCSVLFELYGILSYAVRIVVLSEKPEMESSAFAKMVWYLSSIATITITIILVVVAGFLHPDEIKNLF